MSDVAYNPTDPLQQEFLSALALGETGNSSYAYTEGVGGTNLAGSSNVDSYGFPIWQGQGSSHAAGAFQFQPGTWDQLAAQYGLNFSNPSDQNAAAWYEAQSTYASATGGQSLETALQSGSSNPGVYSTIQSALASVWPSVTGNMSNPGGLALSLGQGGGASIASGLSFSPNATGSSSSGSGQSGASSAATGLIGDVENFFVRFGLIIAGGVVIIVALWQLLSNQGVVPSPAKTAKGIGEAVAA